MRAKTTVGQFARGVSRLVRHRFPVAIGYPFPGVASDWTGHIGQIESEQAEARARARGEHLAAYGAQVFLPGAGVKLSGLGWSGAGIEPRREDWGILPPDVGNLGARSGGDITGARGSKARKARATGAGVDSDVQRAADFEAWQAGGNLIAKLHAARDSEDSDSEDSATARALVVAMEQDLTDLQDRRAAIVQAILAEQDTGKRILTLAGGAGWGNGKRVVTLQSSGMAARAARYVKGKRGHTPSDTSLQEAAAAAAAAIWLHWTALESVGCAVWSPCTMHHLGAMGWRAAFHSFRRDAAQGRKGSRADEPQVSGDIVPLEQATLQVERASLQAWAADRQGRVFDSGADEQAEQRAQRRAVLSWARGVFALHPGGTGAGAAAAARAERARFSVLARLVHGRDIATASHGAGFASGRACLESFSAGKVWQRVHGELLIHTLENQSSMRRSASSYQKNCRDRLCTPPRKQFAMRDLQRQRYATDRPEAGARRCLIVIGFCACHGSNRRLCKMHDGWAALVQFAMTLQPSPLTQDDAKAH